MSHATWSWTQRALLLDRATAKGVLDTAYPELLAATLPEGMAEDLCALLSQPLPATVAQGALQLLQKATTRPAWVWETLRQLLITSPHSSVRLEALRTLALAPFRDHQTQADWDTLSDALRGDGSWHVRRLALETLIHIGQWRAALSIAIDDPYWRVRYALFEALRDHDAFSHPDSEGWTALASHISTLAHKNPPQRFTRANGFGAALHAAILGDSSNTHPSTPTDTFKNPFADTWRWTPPALALSLGPDWSDDPSVLRARLSIYPPEELAFLAPALIALEDEDIQKHTLKALLTCADTTTLAAVFRLAAEPRLSGLNDILSALQTKLSSDPQRLTRITDMLNQWTGDDETFLIPHPFSPHPPSANDPRSRAATLTPEHAESILSGDTPECCAYVLRAAATLLKRPFLHWATTKTNAPPPPATSPIQLEKADESRALLAFETIQPINTTSPLRPLGQTGLQVSALGISGHYGLPFEGYATAMEHGVNTFFWEPLYREQTRFFRALSPQTKQHLVVIAGTFEHDLKRITQNLDAALRAMRIERIALWMLFWVRDTARLCDTTRAHLQKLQAEGKIGAFGFSTHQRDVAVYGLTHNWSPLMTRHSAAHRNPEAHIFPTVQATGSGLITFSNLVYGRLLRPPRTRLNQTLHAQAWTAADCYRYSLGFPCVSASLSAPSTMEQLHENLGALHNPTLSDEARAQLLAHGDLIYRDNTDFHRWIRGR